MTSQEKDALILEMSEALKALVSLHHDWTHGSASIRKAFVVDNDKAIAAARAALAKAADVK